MNTGRFVTHFVCLPAAVLILASVASPTAAFEQHDKHNQSEAARRKPAGALLEVVRDATERFKDVAVADAEGYKLLFGCVSGEDYGAMGLHYVNLPMVFDDVLDPARPEIVIYEPRPDGSLRLIGADYLIFADTWDKKNPTATPQIMGQLMHLFGSPNRFGLPAFYTLHVWAWKDNPTGAFANWHSNVSCEPFTPQN